ncbi:uncharacterized protein RBU57_005190 [Macrochelys suwanniensis]
MSFVVGLSSTMERQHSVWAGVCPAWSPLQVPAQGGEPATLPSEVLSASLSVSPLLPRSGVSWLCLKLPGRLVCSQAPVAVTVGWDWRFLFRLFRPCLHFLFLPPAESLCCPSTRLAATMAALAVLIHGSGGPEPQEPHSKKEPGHVKEQSLKLLTPTTWGIPVWGIPVSLVLLLCGNPSPQPPASPERRSPGPQPPASPERRSPGPQPPASPERRSPGPQPPASPDRRSPGPQPPASPDRRSPGPQPPASPDRRSPGPQPPARPDRRSPGPQPPASPDCRSPGPQPPASPDRRSPGPQPPASPALPLLSCWPQLSLQRFLLQDGTNQTPLKPRGYCIKPLASLPILVRPGALTLARYGVWSVPVTATPPSHPPLGLLFKAAKQPNNLRLAWLLWDIRRPANHPRSLCSEKVLQRLLRDGVTSSPLEQTIIPKEETCLL